MTRNRMGRVRWIIAGLLFGETILNYLDLQTLSVLAPQLEKELGLTSGQYAQVGEVFQLAYLLSFLAGGWVIDRIGARWGTFDPLVVVGRNGQRKPRSMQRKSCFSAAARP